MTMTAGDDGRNYRRWDETCEALRREIAAMRAAGERTRFDNDDGGRDADDERIREKEARLEAIETMLSGREREDGAVKG